MSVYNEPLDWIDFAIESICNQTFSDFEFIIINDNPKRKELIEFLNSKSLIDQRISVYTNVNNIGLTKSLNVGLKHCRGKYIARMDADDISLPRRLEKQVTFMEQNPNVIVCGTNISLFGEFHPFYIKTIFEKDIDIRGQMYFNSGFVHPSVMIRNSVFVQNNIRYDDTYRSAQDYKLWYDLSNLGSFANLNEKLLKYRISNQQVTHKLSTDQQHNRNRIKSLFCADYPSKNKTLQAYYKRATAYYEQKPELLFRASISRYTNITFKERFALLIKAIIKLLPKTNFTD